MTIQDKVKKHFNKGHIYNIRQVGERAGLRDLKLHEFLHGKSKLSDLECASVLRLIDKCNNVSKIVVK